MNTNMNLTEYLASVHYYIQRQLYKEAALLAKEAFEKFDNDYMCFWAVYANFKSGAKTESSALLSIIDKKPDISDITQKIKCLMSGQPLQKLDSYYRPNSNENLIFHMALLYFHEGLIKQAKEYIKNTPENIFLFELIKGIINLAQCKKIPMQNESLTKMSNFLEKARQNLDMACQLKSTHPLLLLFQIDLEEKSKNAKEMGLLINKLNENLKNQTIIGLERVNYFIVCNNWDMASNHLEVLLANDGNNILVQKLKLLEIFVKLSSFGSAFEVYNQITHRIEKDYNFENIGLLLDIVSFVNRVAGNTDILIKHTIKVLTKAKTFAGDNYELLTELGFSYILLHDFENAETCYQRASLLESNKVEHVLRLVQIKLYKNELDEAEANLEFFKEISSTLNCETSEMCFLDVLLCFLKGKRLQEQKVLEENISKRDFNREIEQLFTKSDDLFDQAIRTHVAKIKNLTNNYDFYKILNPSFLLELSFYFMKDVELCFTFSKYNLKQISVPEQFFDKSIRMLEILVQKLPGILTPYIMLIKGHILNCNLEAAQVYIDKLLEKDCIVQDVHIFSLFVALMKGNMSKSDEAAIRALSNSTSSNFELLQNSEFMFLKSQTEILSKNYSIALKSMQKAKQLIEDSGSNEKRADSPDRRNNRHSESLIPKIKHEQSNLRNNEIEKTLKSKKYRKNLKVEIECELAILNVLCGNQQEGKELIQNAISEYAGTFFGIFVILANSDISLINKDLKTAIDILKNVDTFDQGFVISRRKLAEIYLTNLKQKRSYILSLNEIEQRFPSFENQKALADAYFSIAEFEDAQKVFEKLSKQYPENESIALKVGECYMQTHNFIRAKNYFTNLVNSYPQSLSFKVFLGELLLKTHQFLDIIDHLRFDLVVEKVEKNDADLMVYRSTLENKVRAGVLLFEHFNYVFIKSGEQEKFDKARVCLETAVDFQKTLIDHLKSEYKKVDKERKDLADLYHSLMVLLSLKCRDLNDLVPYIDDAIKNDPENLLYHLLHGKLYLSTGNIEIAKEKAKQIFKVDFRHPGAVVLFADCLLQSLQFESGVKGFTKIFEKDYTANNSTFVLTALVWFHRSSGTLSDFLKVLSRYSRLSFGLESDVKKTKGYQNGGNNPNLNYCYGVYHYTTRNYNSAIQELTKARTSQHLLCPSNLLLIDIYLHSNSFNLYSNFLQKEKFKTVQKTHLEIAKTLISELNNEFFVMEKKIYTIVITSLEDSVNIPESIKLFDELMALPSSELFHSLILYYSSLFCLKVKNTDKLKDNFTMIKSLKYQPKHYFDEYFFRANMLYVDTLLYKEKLKPAKTIIDNCINASKSCMLAYDYLIIHNEKAKESCIDVLKTAFSVTNCEDPNIGYKLARDLMNENKPQDSFNICKTVLDKNPKFKQIEKDILLKVKEDLLNYY